MVSSRMQNYRYASDLALLATSESSLKRLQNAIKEEVSEKKATDIRDKAMPLSGELPREMVGAEKTVFFDLYSGRYFTADSIETIRAAVNSINQLAVGEGFATLNEYYYELKLEPVQFGDNIGWTGEGLLEAEFSAKLYEGIPVIVIDFRLEPKEYSYK